jgi:hypothetical protein
MPREARPLFRKHATVGLSDRAGSVTAGRASRGTLRQKLLPTLTRWKGPWPNAVLSSSP